MQESKEKGWVISLRKKKKKIMVLNSKLYVAAGETQEEAGVYKQEMAQLQAIRSWIG